MKPDWQMTVPVLSTCYIQSTTEHELVRTGLSVASYEEGFFVLVGGVTEAEFEQANLPEMVPIVRWFKEQYPEEIWMRFDQDGDEVPTEAGLPRYEW